MSVQNAILGLLASRPRHGYELHDAFEALAGGEQNWDIKPAQIYTTLARLESRGLIVQESIEQDGGPQKVIYSLTEAGSLELERWFTTPVLSQHQHDEVFIKLMISLSLENGDPRKVIYAQRASLYRELHDITSQRSQADPRRELALVLYLDQIGMHLEADLRWLDMVEARLDEIRRQPFPEPEERPRGRPPKVA